MDTVTIRNLYGDCEIFGPYTREDGRKHVVLFNSKTDFRVTVSYPKLLLEIKIGRRLVEPETCDHIDGNFSNDSLDNLRVLNRADNAARSAKPAKVVELECLYCGSQFTQLLRVLNRKNKPNAGKLCSKQCAGLFSHVGPVSQLAEESALKALKVSVRI